MPFIDIAGRSVCYRDWGSRERPAVLLAHPLGMSQMVWDEILPALAGHFRLVSWDLPGHGASDGCEAPIDAQNLADEALALADHLDLARFHFVGTSIGGVVGQQLLLDAPDRLDSVLLTNTGAVLGTPDGWHERASRVRAEGLAAMADEIVQRWFAPEFAVAEPAGVAGWKTQLTRTDAESYARLCELLAAVDFRQRLFDVPVRVGLLGGRADMSTPVDTTLEQLAEELGGTRLEILDAAGHVPSVERPSTFAEYLQHWLADDAMAAPVVEDGASYALGLAVRRDVLGDAHVDKATRSATTLDAPFQRMITRMAWGELWGNPDLGRVERSLITLAVLAALGRDGELELHLKTARRIGVSEAQLRQALMHVAIYAGVPAANHAFKLAKAQGWGEAST